jgi:hypothetical protein
MTWLEVKIHDTHRVVLAKIGLMIGGRLLVKVWWAK